MEIQPEKACQTGEVRAYSNGGNNDGTVLENAKK
jgi:hypothetical protein